MILECKPILDEFGEPIIELKTELGTIDLHSFAHFKSLLYNTGNNSITLRWENSSLGEFCLEQEPIYAVELLFEQVKSWIATERDWEYPLEANENMEEFYIHPQEQGIDFEFVFNSEYTFRIKAVSLKVYIYRSL